MKYCAECGYQCSDNANFCGLCGFSFSEMSLEAVVTETLEETQMAEDAEELEEVNASNQVEEEPVEEEPDKTEEKIEDDEEESDQVEEAEKSEEIVEPDTKEYYKQQVLKNEKMIDDLKAQQQQMQLQMKTMQQQQWNQTQQQQRQQKMISYYNNQISQQRMQAQVKSKGVAIRNIWSLVAAVVCLLPFFISGFINHNLKYYNGTCGLVEYCRDVADEISYSSNVTVSEWITAMLPITVLVLVVILIIGTYMPVYRVRGWVVIVNIISIIVTFFYVKSEESYYTTFGISFWILTMGIGLAAYSCCTDNHEVGINVGEINYDDIQGASYNLSMLAADSSMELKQEWRCPKCDSKNLIDYKYCRICSTPRN